MLELMLWDNGLPWGMGGLKHDGSLATVLKPWSQWLVGNNCCGIVKIAQANESLFTFRSPAQVIFNCLTSSPRVEGGWGWGLSGGFCQPEQGGRWVSSQHRVCSTSAQDDAPAPSDSQPSLLETRPAQRSIWKPQPQIPLSLTCHGAQAVTSFLRLSFFTKRRSWARHNDLEKPLPGQDSRIPAFGPKVSWKIVCGLLESDRTEFES